MFARRAPSGRHRAPSARRCDTLVLLAVQDVLIIATDGDDDAAATESCANSELLGAAERRRWTPEERRRDVRKKTGVEKIKKRPGEEP